MPLTTEEWQEKIDNPDPRIKWAMDVMDREGQDFEGDIGRAGAPLSAGLFPIFGNTARNMSNRVPLRTNIIAALAFVPFFAVGGYYFR